MIRKVLFLALVASSLHGSWARADLVNPGLTGTVQTDTWPVGSLNGTNYPNYGGGFPGSAAWPSAIVSSSGSAGHNAAFNKTSGNAYVATVTVYNGGFSGVANTQGANFSIADATVVSGLQTVVLQTVIGEAFGHEFFNDNPGPTSTVGLPVLSYNGGNQNLVGTIVSFDRFDTGQTFDPGTGPQEVYVDSVMMRWDLTGAGANSLNLTWTNVQHAQISGLQLDQSNTPFAVPEPGTLSLGLFAGVGLVAATWRGRRRAVGKRGYDLAQA